VSDDGDEDDDLDEDDDPSVPNAEDLIARWEQKHRTESPSYYQSAQKLHSALESLIARSNDLIAQEALKGAKQTQPVGVKPRVRAVPTMNARKKRRP